MRGSILEHLAFKEWYPLSLPKMSNFLLKWFRHKSKQLSCFKQKQNYGMPVWRKGNLREETPQVRQWKIFRHYIYVYVDSQASRILIDLAAVLACLSGLFFFVLFSLTFGRPWHFICTLIKRKWKSGGLFGPEMERKLFWKYCFHSSSWYQAQGWGMSIVTVLSLNSFWHK